ncbi:MAG: AI-2E family transporter [Muribaculaceae bacterium]|nr:AI-2E family transporter [Muribaculaceae bacterium]
MKMWSSRPYTFDRVVRIVFSLAVLAGLIWLVAVLRHVLLPFAVAALVAYMMEPWVRYNRRKMRLKSRCVAVLITCGEIIVVFAIMCLIFIPLVENECAQLSDMLDRYARNGHPGIGHFPETIHRFVRTRLDIDTIASKLDNVNTMSALRGMWDALSSGLNEILALLGWVIAIVYVFFISLDLNKYRSDFYRYMPRRWLPAAKSVAHDVSWTMNRYFRNQALISLITGLCYVVGFSIVGIPMAVAIGLVNCVLFMVPYLVYVSVVPVTVMCIFHAIDTGVDFWTIWLECVAVYAAVEAFSDLFLTPRIMGKAMGLNPAVILLALSVWGTLLGVLGMVIALPATTIMIKWLKMWLVSIDRARQPGAVTSQSGAETGSSS